MPEEVRAEIGPYFVERSAIVDEDSRKLPKLNDDTADYVKSGLTVRKKSYLFLHFRLVRFHYSLLTGPIHFYCCHYKHAATME